VIAPLAQCDYKKTVAKTACDSDCKKKKNRCKKQVKSAIAKNQFKKSSSHDTVRLRLSWCLLDVVATW
jgi:hypothetical protein